MTKTSKIKLLYENWRFFAWAKDFENTTTLISNDGSFDGNWNRLIQVTKDDEDQHALKQYKGFTDAVPELIQCLKKFTEVEKIILFGSVAKPPFLEPHPYSRRLRRKGVHIFHTPKDIDLAIWLSSLDNLGTIRKTLGKLLSGITNQTYGLCSNAVELFVFDSKTSDYLGRVCHFKRCPREGIECLSKGCGQPAYLKTMDGFVLYPDALSHINSQILFERFSDVGTPTANLLTKLPQILAEEQINKLVVSKNVRIERIVSTGHTSPPGFWYDQDETEWVVILQGKATLEFKDKTLNLTPGDYVLIPPHQKHRVAGTSTKEPTVWLAFFFSDEQKTIPKKNTKKNTVKKSAKKHS